MTNMPSLAALIEPVVKAMGLNLVRVAVTGGQSGGITLQVMAEDPATDQLTIDQCVTLSRRLSTMLDEEDPIESEYDLEVSSPGIDRPLTRLADFDRWAGHVARIEHGAGIEVQGSLRKRFQGPLVGTSDGDVEVDVDGLGRVRLPFAELSSAKLVLTDALIAATRPLDASGADEQDIEQEEDVDGTPSRQ